MKRRWTILFLSFALFTNGCSEQESKWQAAKNLNRIDAFENFLKEYPDSKYTKEAKQFIEKEKIRIERNEIIDLASLVIIKVMTQTGSIINPGAPEFSGRLSELIIKYKNIQFVGMDIGGIEANLNGSSIKFSPEGVTSVKFNNPSYTILFSNGEFGINDSNSEIIYKNKLTVKVNGVEYFFKDYTWIKN